MVDKNVKEVDKMIFVVIFPRFSWFFYAKSSTILTF